MFATVAQCGTPSEPERGSDISQVAWFLGDDRNNVPSREVTRCHESQTHTAGSRVPARVAERLVDVPNARCPKIALCLLLARPDENVPALA